MAVHYGLLFLFLPYFQKSRFRIAALIRKRPGRGIRGRGGAASLSNSAGILYHACPEKSKYHQQF